MRKSRKIFFSGFSKKTRKLSKTWKIIEKEEIMEIKAEIKKIFHLWFFSEVTKVENDGKISNNAEKG
jgi:hypothetical protein